MLKYFTLLIVFFVANTSFAQLIDYDKIDTARVYRSMEEANTNPLQVYRLDLSKKKLKVFPKEILTFTNLNELILDKNKLDSIPISISKLLYLQRLSAYKNNLVNIDFITVLPNLTYLDLTANYIEAIPQEISHLQKLRTLILQLNTITEFPNSMSELDLVEFNLLDNELNHEQQAHVRSLFPNLRVEMSAPCHCNTNDEDE